MHIIHKFFCLLLLICLSQACYGQTSRKVSLAAGFTNFSSPGLNRNIPGKAYLIAFDYHLAKHSIIGLSYQYGASDYYQINNPQNILLNAEDESFTNTELFYSAVSFMYKYSFLNPESPFVLNLGAGAALTTIQQDYATYDPEYSFAIKTTSVFNTLSFPLRAEAAFKLTSFLHIGLMGGAYIEPDFEPAVVGYHWGASVRYLFP